MTGRDYWDLLISTPPSAIEPLIQLIEDKAFNSFPISMQKVFYPKYRALLFSLFKMLNQVKEMSTVTGTSITNGKLRALEELFRLEMSRAMSVITFSVQRSLDYEHLSREHQNYSYKTGQKNMIKSSIINIDSSSQSNLSALVSELLQDKIGISKFSNLNEIVSYLSNNKLYQININQQVISKYKKITKP